MIDLELGDEHQALVETVRGWAAKEVQPQIHDLDREHRFNRDFLKGMAELQLLGICIPEEWGGAGMDYLSLGLACEELEYVDTHLRVIMSVHVGLNSMTLLVLGQRGAEAEATWCRRPRARRSRPTALTEPNAGSDAVGDPDDRGAQGRPLRAERREDVDQPRRRGRPLPGDRLDRPGEEEEPRPLAACRPSSWSAASRASPRSRSRRSGASWPATPAASRCRTSRCRSRTALGEEGEGFKVAMFALENGRYTVAVGRHRPDPRLPRRLGPLRPGPQGLRRADRAAPAGQGDDRADGLRLRRGAPALAARRLAEERGPAQHARDLARQVVRDRGERARGLRRGADPRRQRLLRRVPGRPLLPQLQGGGDLRGHAARSTS